MALNGNGGIDATMLVQPGTMPNYGNMGGGFGLGNDFATWMILLLVLGGGWGGFGGFGMGGYGAMMGMGMMGMDYLYPWLNNSQNINNGFRDQQISTQINGIQSGIQSIKDDLCADRLEAERRENQTLRTQLSMAQLAASQVDQTAQLRASQAATANQLVAELRSCPIPSQPVYGNQPIFTCPQQASPCNCNGNF